jgi:hypothetical protein
VMLKILRPMEHDVGGGGLVSNCEIVSYCGAFLDRQKIPSGWKPRNQPGFKHV